MSAQHPREYAASDLKELMDNTGGWARNWNDVLRYLEGPAVKDADFSRKEVPELIEDVERLKDKQVGFTTDYRKVWRELTGEKTDDLPPPEGVKEPAVDPLELEDRFLKGLAFPASKQDVVQHAEKKRAPGRVRKILQKIDAKQYKEMAEVQEAVGDVSWDHD